MVARYNSIEMVHNTATTLEWLCFPALSQHDGIVEYDTAALEWHDLFYFGSVLLSDVLLKDGNDVISCPSQYQPEPLLRMCDIIT